MVGDAIYSTASKEKISDLIEFVSTVCTDDELINKWKNESIELLSGQRQFEYSYWCDHMFN